MKYVSYDSIVFLFSYFGIPYSHDMCECKTCFPNNEPCIRQCHNDYVSCPLVANDMKIGGNADSKETTKEGRSTSSGHFNEEDLLKIVQQPTDLPNLTKLYTQKAIDFMNTSTIAAKPFFLYMAYHQTHHPQFAGV